ncbi:MAG: hypothetical protein AAF725_23505 [Acidobacteriota bacterium]
MTRSRLLTALTAFLLFATPVLATWCGACQVGECEPAGPAVEAARAEGGEREGDLPPCHEALAGRTEAPPPEDEDCHRGEEPPIASCCLEAPAPAATVTESAPVPEPGGPALEAPRRSAHSPKPGLDRTSLRRAEGPDSEPARPLYTLHAAFLI